MSAPQRHDQPEGNRPNYHNEPAELPGHGPAELAADVPGAQSHRVHSNVGAEHGNQEFFPPPPPGPPPLSLPPPSAASPSSLSSAVASGLEKQHQEQYYPPPPPGPPPAFDSHGQQQYASAPPLPPKQAYAEQEPPQDFRSDSPPPSYAEAFGDGAGFSGSTGDNKTPIPGPPGPSAAGPGPPPLPPRPEIVFPPPPTSPSQDSAGEGFWGKYGKYAGSGRGAGGSGSSGGSPGGSGGGGGGFAEKLYRWSIKAGEPVNRIANKFGSEAFWPMSLDQECDKAARILLGFCKNGFYSHDNQAQRPQAPRPPSTPPSPSRFSPGKPPSPVSPSKALLKIPPSVIANAKGLAIFTTFRTALHFSGSGGSGVVVARLADGSWSPPAGFLVHTLGAGFVVGFDVYDCVCVLTTQQSVDAFMRRARLSLGGDLAVVAGPVGVGGVLESGWGLGKASPGSTPGNTNTNASPGNGVGNNARPDGGSPGGSGSDSGKPENRPVWSYMKSRGFYAGVQVDGTVIVPRPDANAAFYGERGISVERILKGQVNTHSQEDTKKDKELVMWPEGGRQLAEVLKAVEGKRADGNVLRGLGDKPTPGDLAPEASGEKPYGAGSAAPS